MPTTYTPYYKGKSISLPPLDMKVDKKITECTTSVLDYLDSPYTMLSALPFGDSSLRLDDGSLFVHKDEQIESTAMVLYNNGIRCYLLSVDEQTGEVTNVTDNGSWMLNQVGLSVMDIWRNGESGWIGSDHSLANVLTSLNTSLGNKVNVYTMSQAQMDQTIGNNYLSIGWNIINNMAYISFDIAWIRIQFRANSGNYVACRMKFGNNGWSSWKNIYS